MASDVIVQRIIDASAEAPPEPTTAMARAGARWLDPLRPSAYVELELALPRVLDPRLVLLGDPGSAQARSYRLLRHRMYCAGDPRVVAVTSARPGEGKTTCALNLALAAAEDALTRVLLVEANLRRPALGRALGFTPSSSFVEKVTRISSLDGCRVAALGGTRLHVAALPPLVPGGLRLDRTLYAAALAELREMYDYVIVDAAAVFESGDADVVGEAADGVLLTARAARTRRRDVRRALTQLAPAPVLGTVLVEG